MNVIPTWYNNINTALMLFYHGYFESTCNAIYSAFLYQQPANYFELDA